jgi:hypothetical protein
MENQERLDSDEPGAPPGFLIDPEDARTHAEVTAVHVEVDRDATSLAEGAGEVEDDEFEEEDDGA